VRLVIPTIGVDAAVERVGVTPQGSMDVPRDAHDVAWFAPGVAPGQSGDAVMAGHLDWSTGPAVFKDLGRLQPGDQMTVRMPGGRALVFRVYRSAEYPADRPPAYLFVAGGPPRLTLVTCSGTWNGRMYNRRLVVDAALS
jgi:sortase (surface protein transpeptidase)